MTIYYIDPANGNDTNDGLSWGSAWKTLLNGATSARLGVTDSDEIRIAKSPDPISIGSQTWTHNALHNLTVSTLSNILIDNCETAWSAGLVTPTVTTTYYRQGTNAVQAVLASINGKVCFKSFTSVNLSEYSRLTFWVNLGASTNYIASNPFQIWLCSDTNGATPVLKFTLPKYYYPANGWIPITLNVDSGFNWADATAIQSISLNTTVSTSATIRMDNFSVAKSASDSTSLVLTDLIAKNNGEGQYFPIQFINGTTVSLSTPIGLNAIASSASSNITNYYSINGTETVDTVKRECFNTALDVPAGSNSTAILNINYSNSSASTVDTKTYQGGYNTSTNTVDGETWFDGITTWGAALSQTNIWTGNYAVDNISVVRYYFGMYARVGDNSSITNCSSVNCYQSYDFNLTDSFSSRANMASASNYSFKWIYTGLGGTLPAARISNSGFWTRVIRPDLRPNLFVTNLYNRAAAPSISFTAQPFNFTSTGTIYANQTNVTNLGIVQCPVLGKVTVNNVLTFATGSYQTLYYFFMPKIDGNTSYLTYGVPNRVVYVNGVVGEVVSGILGTSNSLLTGSTDVAGNILIEGTSSNATFNYSTWFSRLPSNPGHITIRNIKTNQTLPTGFSTGSVDSYPGSISFEKWNQTSTHRVFTFTTTQALNSSIFNYWETQSSVVSSGATAWRKFYVNDNPYGYGCPDHFIIATPTFKAGSQVTITLKTRRTSLNAYGYLMIEGALAGVSDTLVSKASGSTNQWETLTITFTPPHNVVVPIYMGATNTANASNQSVYFDDLTITQD